MQKRKIIIVSLSIISALALMTIFLSFKNYSDKKMFAFGDTNKTNATSMPINTATLNRVQEIITSPTQFYTIDSNYPQIAGNNLSTNDIQFNTIIKSLTTQIISSFKNTVLPPEKLQQISDVELPINTKSNELAIKYDIKSNTRALISVLFTNDVYYYHREYPDVFYWTVTYDRAKGKVITLDDLYNDNSQYLNSIANYCQQALFKLNIADSNWIKKGTAPTKNNYKLWNLTSDGILITFPPKQVAPQSAGTQSVLVPYTLLKTH